MQNQRMVSLTRDEYNIVKRDVEKIVDRKMKSQYYKEDKSKIIDRFLSGYLAEAAIEKFLKIKFSDRSVGTSSSYNIPDIKSLNVGVKVANVGNAHLVPTTPKYGEILVQQHSDTEFEILCYASTYIMTRLAKTELVKSPAVKARGDKKGFNSYVFCHKFSNIDELVSLIKRDEINKKMRDEKRRADETAKAKNNPFADTNLNPFKKAA